MKMKLFLSYAAVAILAFGAGWVGGHATGFVAELERGEAHVHTWGPFGNGTSCDTGWAVCMVQYRNCLTCGIMERRTIKDVR